jgi:hypothetical protein
VRNQVRALAAPDGPRFAAEDVRVVLCSSMGTVAPPAINPLGDILFYKLNAEAWLLSAGVPAVIVKPGGLTNAPGGARKLVVGHDDSLDPAWPGGGPAPSIPRADVARVMVAALLDAGAMAGHIPTLRFDVAAVEGDPTTDLDRLLRDAAWAWE